MEVVMTTGAISRVKLQSNHYHQQTNTQLFTSQMPFLSPTNSVKALKGIGDNKLKMGKDWYNIGAFWFYGTSKIRERPIQFANLNNLTVTNTCFKQQKKICSSAAGRGYLPVAIHTA